MIHLLDLSFSYSQKQILYDISVHIEKGNICAIMGLNGSGKSTLLKILCKLLPLQTGTIQIAGKDIRQYSQKEIAQNISYVPQRQDYIFDFSVYEMVKMGRNPWIKQVWDTFSIKEEELIENSLRQCNLLDFREKMLSQLSGGELQRSLIARSLVQQTPIMLLDEPFSNLDVVHKFEMFDLLTQINNQMNTTILIILHDFMLAKRYCHQTLILDKGKLAAFGNSQDIIQAVYLSSAFGLSSDYQIDNSGNIYKK